MDSYTTTNSYYGFDYHPSPTVIAIWIIIYIIQVIGLWKIYEKAGKPGWAAIIPFYNIIVLLQIVNRPWWYLLLIFIPCANLVFIIWGIILINNLLSKAFGQGVGFTIGLIFLSFIFIPLLGFGDYQYQGGPKPFGADDYQKPFDINSGE